MKTLVIAPSILRLGGITTVVSSHRASPMWEEWGCVWIGTSLSRSAVWKLLWFIGALLRFCWHLPGADLVHIHVANGASVVRKRIFFYLAFWLRKKLIVHLHAPSFEPEEAASRFEQLRGMFEGADRVVALSESWAAQIREHIPNARVSVVPNAVQRPEVAKDIVHRRPVIFYAGKLESRKGYNHLIEAFALLKDALPDWELELAGDGETEAAAQLAEKLGIQHRTRILGWVHRDEMLKLMGSSRIFCLPSFAEGFPMSVLEALAQGCAVVTTPVGGLKDDLMDGKDLVFAPPGDSAALAAALLKVAASNELMQQLSDRGRMLSATTYARENSLIAMEVVYQGVTR